MDFAGIWLGSMAVVPLHSAYSYQLVRLTIALIILASCSYLLPVPTLLKIFLLVSFLILYPPTGWRLQYLLWRVSHTGSQPRKYHVFLSSTERSCNARTRTLVPTSRIYSPTIDFIVSRLAADVFGALSDPGSTLNDIACRTCRAFAEGLEPRGSIPSPQEIAKYFRQTPPNIHVKPSLDPGSVNEEDRENGIVVNDLFLAELIGAFSYQRYTQVEFILVVSIFHQAIDCLTTHIYGGTISPASHGNMWGADGDSESGSVAESLLAGGRIVLQFKKSETPYNWEDFHSIVFQAGTIGQRSENFCRFGLLQQWIYRRCFGQRNVETPIFGAGRHGPLEPIPAEVNKYERLPLTGHPSPHLSCRSVNLRDCGISGFGLSKQQFEYGPRCAVRENI